MGDLCAKLCELGRILEEFHNLFKLCLFLIRTRNVGEEDLLLVGRGGLDLCLSEGCDLSAGSSASLAHKEYPEGDHCHDKDNIGQEGYPEGHSLCGLKIIGFYIILVVLINYELLIYIACEEGY